MNRLHATAFALLIGVPLIGACSQQPAARDAANEAATTTASNSPPKTLLGKSVASGLEQAREELHRGNISLNGHDVTINGRDYARTDNDMRPEAEITPKGDLLLAGKAVAVTPQQRAMLLDYRGQIIAIADAGIILGGKGADLAGKAIGDALGSIFSGDAAAMERRVEAEASKLEAEAKLICNQLQPMLTTQQELAASLDAFKPYATMTQSDVDDCMSDIDDKGVWSTQ